MHQPGTPSTPSRRLPNSSSPAHDGAAYQTALRGASLAFQRTGPSPKSSTTVLRNNGALIAAASASRDHSLSRSPSRAQNASRAISRQTTGGSVQDGSYGHDVHHGTVSQRLAQLHHAQPPPTVQSLQGQNAAFLKPPGKSNMAADPRSSPSFIAATLAASRSASPSPSQLPQVHPYAQHAATRIRRKNSVGAQSAASSVASLDLTDTTSIPPANSLISMFEKKGDGVDTDPIKRGPKLRPVTPQRPASPAKQPDLSPSRLGGGVAWEGAASPPSSSIEVRHHTSGRSAVTAIESKRRLPTPPVPRASRPELEKRESTQAVAKSKPRAVTPPRPISRANTVILSPQPRRAASHKMVRPEAPPGKGPKVTSKKPPPPAVKPKPRPQSIHSISPITLRSEPRSPVMPLRKVSTASSNDTFVSASSAQSPEPGSPERGRSRAPIHELRRQARPASAQSLPIDIVPKRRNPVPPPPRRSQASSSNLALSSLTDATMAGILASSRATPTSLPASSPPPLLPSRKHNPPFHMRQTLRQPTTKSDDEETRRNKSRHRKKPLQKSKHSHHEGARRRWREEITPRERKRYEGVWASNRGLLVALSSPESSSSSSRNGTPANNSSGSGNGNGSGSGNNYVANVVVRDVWSRSRLPFDELAEVWDLVDLQGRGVLDKAEFVVGMWLIDQRLRGRKIPQKVMDSVWASAKGLRVMEPPKVKGRGRKHH
ncbi:uncharacterized protein JN550_000008 [Neoarthrinium moseri]|uniref:uncharacterized protein n=1 Tax=Neoarthrinium moseri TaxID=1658444 RepID=UPI001FDE2EDC|nr:uncharacterized protein JN550_000008 [Neoarthrinium moseri]KAI1877826.1 hypothetical protein JN550_000008 [Neoarthrinium moseri]